MNNFIVCVVMPQTCVYAAGWMRAETFLADEDDDVSIEALHAMREFEKQLCITL